MTKQFIPRQKVPVLKANFAKIERKALKLGFEKPILTIYESETEVRKVIEENFTQRVEKDVVFVAVEVTGKLPVYEGWNLVAAIEHTRFVEGESNFNVVRMVPNAPEMIELRTADSGCEHCGHNRFRKNTYLLKNEDTGDMKRVGSTCVKDFLGDENPEKILNAVNFVTLLQKFTDDLDGGWWGSFEKEYGVKEVLLITSSQIRNRGWVSKGQAYDSREFNSTADYIQQILINDGKQYNAGEKEILDDIGDADKEIVAGAIEWMKGFDLLDPNINDYIYNAALCVKREFIGLKDLGVTCSIISSYKNKLAKEAADKIPKKISNFVGTEKERLKDLELTFLKAWTFDSSFGVCTILRFTDEDGNIFIWKTGYVDDIEAGTELVLTGTVKKHELYRDAKQTVLTRCKWDYKENK